MRESGWIAQYTDGTTHQELEFDGILGVMLEVIPTIAKQTPRKMSHEQTYQVWRDVKPNSLS